MREAFSLNREFDYVRLDGLRRATGQPAHEWDIYIVKELIDNALDADESLWQDGVTVLHPHHILIEYISIPKLQSQQLFIQVTNNAIFPVSKIEDIFATQSYTSHKAFFKGLMRGALGNALKTLLGIPYALRHRVAGDWNPELKPLSIRCNGVEYLPRYVIDSTAQTIGFEYLEKPCRFTKGTAIRVGVDHFVQEIPRTLEQIQSFAEKYHLCNPHAQFSWTVEIQGQEWTKKYSADADWRGKFRGIAPVQWYSPTAFQDLLGALYRKQNTNELPVKTICDCFVGLDSGTAPIAQIIDSFGQDGLTATEIESASATQLYRILCRYSPHFDSISLGNIGTKHIQSVLTQALPVDGKVFYEIATDAGDDPNMPFVIEVAVAHLKESELQGGKRQVWTAINFTHTYADPFLRRWLFVPIQTEQPVLGLRGFLDAYSLREDIPVIFFLHLICPNVEHSEFSKTDINHLPFKQILGKVLDKLLVAFREAREEEELQLEKSIFAALDSILGEVDKNERFAPGQLLEKLKARLQQNPVFADWLQTPDAINRLQTYIERYNSKDATFAHRVIRLQEDAHRIIRPQEEIMSVPWHPNHHFSVLTGEVSRVLLTQYHVNKILYVRVRELEQVVIHNGWLCRMDMALLHNQNSDEELKAALVECLDRTKLPILVLHNVEEDEYRTVKQMREWLREENKNTAQIVDLGLNLPDSLHTSVQPTKLMQMMPGELANWLLRRFDVLGIPTKYLPEDAEIRQEISTKFEQLLQGYLLETVWYRLKMPRLLGDIDRQLNFTQTMMNQKLDEQLKHSLLEEASNNSYTAVLEKVTTDFFRNFMQDQGLKIDRMLDEQLKGIREV
ncbi:MAG: ATP-binding protein [Symploca sp. SIO2E6]|nr:ATP-binding protein [Symploca sp. SIO2E6]